MQLVGEGGGERKEISSLFKLSTIYCEPFCCSFLEGGLGSTPSSLVF